MKIKDSISVNKDLLTWTTDDNYNTALKIKNAIKIVNDITERKFKLTIEWNDCLIKGEEEKQFVLKIVTDYN